MNVYTIDLLVDVLVFVMTLVVGYSVYTGFFKDGE